MATEIIKTSGQSLVDRVCNIEHECIEKHGVFDRDLLSEEVKDTYDNLCLRLDEDKELAEILEKLDSVFRPSEGRRWLYTPLDIFERHRPIDLIARGEGYRVLQMLVRIEEGIHV